MKLIELKEILNALEEINFTQENGNLIPKHFHLTEVGEISRKFIDCGGVLRTEKKINLQLWVADDINHRLSPAKFLDILNSAQEQLSLDPSNEVELEYQSDTICKYGLTLNGKDLTFSNLSTNCLAPDKCGVPSQKIRTNMRDLETNLSCCKPGTNCC